MRIGVIGGTGLYSLGPGTDEVLVETPHGARSVQVTEADGHTYFFLNRHGAAHVLPAHRVDHRANVLALKACRVDAVLAVYNVGGLTARAPPGSFVVPDDFVDLNPRDDGTLFDDEARHIDLSNPYCPRVRAAFLMSSDSSASPPADGGTYVAVRGPRLETPAEVRYLATLGDMVGMTGCPEAALAREAGLCYAGLAFVANAGTTEGAGHKAGDIRAALEAQGPRVQALVLGAAAALSDKPACACREAPERARIHQS